ncbi:hypothetical protein [Peribacillus frigoritolerans]|uniref:hypothetical protein n=1 Tax=Peribacillus frigoritolerans TaxID=450367 RepID=UPI003B8B028D
MGYFIYYYRYCCLLIFIFKKQIKNPVNAPLKTDSTINIVSSLPLEIPWNIDSYKSTNMQLYETPKKMILTDNLKRHIDNVIRLTPTAKDIVQIEKKVVVKFSEDILNKINSGDLKIMKKKGSVDQFRSIAVDQKNKIRSHGWLEGKVIKKVNPAQLANAALGVMTIITAQEHLEKINKQLNVIDRKIHNLLRLYQNDKIGKIQGSIRYLKSILPDISIGNITKDNNSLYLTKIEDISLQCYQEIQSLLHEFPQIINEISSIKERTIIGLDKIVNELQELTNTFEQKLLIAFGNLEVMSICLKIRNDLEKNSKVNLNRLLDIENDYKQLLGFQDRINSILTDKQLGLNATFRTSKAVSKRKEEIEKQLEYHNVNINSNKSSVNQHIHQLRNHSDLLNEPIDLQVEYDEEHNVTAVYKLKRVK